MDAAAQSPEPGWGTKHRDQHRKAGFESRRVFVFSLGLLGLFFIPRDK